MMPRTTPDFSTDSMQGKRFHFVGIGGCGMSGLALLLTNLGAHVQGTDSVLTEVTLALEQSGIEVFSAQDGSSIHDEIDIIVHSAAIPPEHPEISKGDEMGIPVTTYAQMLGFVQSHNTGVCIAGTHGKSTTVSMLCAILMDSGFDPSFIVGAYCNQIGGSSRVGSETICSGPLKGQPGILISESCEFNRSFHDHVPTLGLINNIEEDHLDYYHSLDAIIESFRGFAKRIPPSSKGGYLLIAHDEAHRHTVTPGLECEVETFGFHPEADYQVVFDPSVQRVGILRDGMWTIQWTNPMPGAHNALNATAGCYPRCALRARLGKDSRAH